MENYDAIIIGSGQAGNPLAVKYAVSGFKVALVEREYIGGSCVNVGCSPTKTMEASGRVAYLAQRASDYGVQTGPVSVDLEKVRERKRHIVTSFSEGDRRRMEKIDGLDLIMGEASFTGPKEIEVALNDGGSRKLSGEKIFIDTGTRSVRPDIKGLAKCAVLNNATIMELDTVPEHLMVLGGGYIGMEFGRMFRRFGSEVTIIQQAEQVLTMEDPDIADEIYKIFTEDGIRILLDADTKAASQDGNGTIHLTISMPAGEETISGSHLLLAAGRVPNTDVLNLESAGVKTDERGFIIADDKLRTTVEDIYALGDVKGGPAFTHIAYDDYRIVKTNLFEDGDVNIKERQLPYVVYIDPQLGRIGLTETEANRRGLKFKTVKMPMSHVARALEMEESRGFLKALVDTDTGKIIGFAALGIEGGELMAVVQMAMMGGLTYRDLKNSIFAHPSLAESLNNLFGLVDRQ